MRDCLRTMVLERIRRLILGELSDSPGSDYNTRRKRSGQSILTCLRKGAGDSPTVPYEHVQETATP